jgi:hypothetical protein
VDVGRALVSKGIALGQLDRSAEEITAYDEVVTRFGDADDPALLEEVAKALVNKGAMPSERNDPTRTHRPSVERAQPSRVLTRYP